MTDAKDMQTEEMKKVKHEIVFDDGRIEAMDEFKSPEELYQDLVSRVLKYHPSDDISMIDKAYKIAYDAHKEQIRKSGEPYIIHPLCVAII
jgi:GTP diphosphokinase / guanosine-3',5'-bis(diphosphate) 3'-diphosphatase